MNANDSTRSCVMWWPLQEGWLHPGFFHRALLKGLTPGARYHYRFGSDSLGFSEEFSFLAAPEVGPHTEFRGLMLADCGQAEPDMSMEQSEMSPSLDTVRWMLRDLDEADYALIGHFGDISYARGHVSQWDRCAPRRPLRAPCRCPPRRRQRRRHASALGECSVSARPA